MADTGTITVRLGSRQARAVFAALVRGIDEWGAELDEPSPPDGLSEADVAAASEGLRKIVDASHEKGWDLAADR